MVGHDRTSKSIRSSGVICLLQSGFGPVVTSYGEYVAPVSFQRDLVESVYWHISLPLFGILGY